MTIPTTEHQARLDGIVAAKRGVPFLDNPYPLGCSRSRAWTRGWRAAQR